jgi:hypothetical protein
VVEEDRAGCPRNCGFDVGVGKDDGRRLAAELQRALLEIPGGSLDDEPSNLRRSGERDFVGSLRS